MFIGAGGDIPIGQVNGFVHLNRKFRALKSGVTLRQGIYDFGFGRDGAGNIFAGRKSVIIGKGVDVVNIRVVIIHFLDDDFALLPFVEESSTATALMVWFLSFLAALFLQLADFGDFSSRQLINFFG
ncbi:MAG: hypothetical protein ACK5L3_09600 [Oscillospiraceae bacterium]